MYAHQGVHVHCICTDKFEELKGVWGQNMARRRREWGRENTIIDENEFQFYAPLRSKSTITQI